MAGKHYLLIPLLLVSIASYAVSLKTNPPQLYTVQEDDTLWSVASEFLQKPWQWQLLWQANPRHHTPPTLYPGAILKLHQQGKVYLELKRRARVKLSPKSPRHQLPAPIKALPVDTIQSFLHKSTVFEQPTTATAPYVVAFAGEQVISGGLAPIYATAVPRNQKHYSIYHTDVPLRDPITQQSIGYFGQHIADALVTAHGDTATLQPTRVHLPINIGDHLVPTSPHRSNKLKLNFYPRAPKRAIDAQIIHLFNDTAHAGNHQIVILSQGYNQGLRPGDVLSVLRPGRHIIAQRLNRRITLPAEHLAYVMVFRTFKHVSFAWTLRTTTPLKRHDHAVTPR
jgi:LysM repeat protein